MTVTDNEQVIFVDVDDTIVMHDAEKYESLPGVTVKDPYSGINMYLHYHPAHVLLIQERAMRGAHIKVMSAGGYLWVKAIITALRLEDYVSECLSKPIAIIDDLPIEQALCKTTYMDPFSKWKNQLTKEA